MSYIQFESEIQYVFKSSYLLNVIYLEALLEKWFASNLLFENYLNNKVTFLTSHYQLITFLDCITLGICNKFLLIQS